MPKLKSYTERQKYVAIIFCENNSLQTKTYAEIFAKRADKIMTIKK